MDSRILCVEYGALINKVLIGVPLTMKQMTKASEAIAQFIYDKGLSQLFDDIVLKTSYRDGIMTEENKIESWLETQDGYRLNNFDMESLRTRILWKKKFGF